MVGVDIHKAVGGKSAVELAEERLRKEQSEYKPFGNSNSTGGYQGITIPDLNEKVDVKPTASVWGKEEKKSAPAGGLNLFKGLENKDKPNKKRLDEESSDDEPKKEVVQKVEETPTLNLLDFGSESAP